VRAPASAAVRMPSRRVARSRSASASQACWTRPTRTGGAVGAWTRAGEAGTSAAVIRRIGPVCRWRMGVAARHTIRPCASHGSGPLPRTSSVRRTRTRSPAPPTCPCSGAVPRWRRSTRGCRRATSGWRCATRWTCPRTGGTASTSHLAAEQTPWSPSAPSTRVRAVGDILVRARGLTKRFGDFTAVDGIDVDVRRGEAFGFLGPNGAGKSSTMRMVGCVSPVTAGELTILGLDPASDGPAIRARLGVCPQNDILDEDLSVEENLWVYGRFFGLSRTEVRTRADELLEFAQLTERRHDRVEPLSGGMKRRLTIARSLMNNPEVLLLDEPTTGLDPQARHLLWDRLFRLKARGVTLVITTHYMDEAEQLCDRLVVMDHGRIVAEGSPLELIAEHSTREVAELRFGVGDHDDLAARVADLAERVEVLPDRVLLYTRDGEATLAAVHERG